MEQLQAENMQLQQKCPVAVPDKFDGNQAGSVLSKDSLQAALHEALQLEGTLGERATSDIDPRSHVASSHYSKKASSLHPRPARFQAVSSVSQQFSAASSSHPSRASSHCSDVSKVSKAASYADQAAEAEIEAAVADVDLRATEEVTRQKEAVAAQAEVQASQQAEMAKAQASQQVQMAKQQAERAKAQASQQAEMAKAQAKLELLIRQRETATKTAQAAALQKIANAASLNFSLDRLPEPRNQKEEFQPQTLNASHKPEIVRPKTRDSIPKNRKPNPMSQDLLGKQLRPPVTTKIFQQVGMQTATIATLNSRAKEFLPHPQGISNADMRIPAYVLTDHDLLIKYTENHQLSTTIALEPEHYAYEDAIPRDDLPSQRGNREPLLQWGKLDLAANKLKFLLAWLGPQSVEIVKDIYSAIVNDPSTALKQVEPSFALLQEFVARQTLNNYLPIDKAHNRNSTPLKSIVQIAREHNLTTTHKTGVVTSAIKSASENPSDTTQFKSPTMKRVQFCPLHNSRHLLNRCQAFAQKPLCLSDMHPAVLHPDPDPPQQTTPNPPSNKVPQQAAKIQPGPAASVKCMAVCADPLFPRFCHQICLANMYPDDTWKKPSSFFDLFDIQKDEVHFMISMCTIPQCMVGRRATGLCIAPLDGSSHFLLPPVLEWDGIPSDRSQIATPEVASNIPHLKHLAHHFPALDPEAEILLLLGVDAPYTLACIKLVMGLTYAPFAFKTQLGWGITGVVCVNRLQAPTQAHTLATSVLKNGRPSHLKPCQEHFTLSAIKPVLGEALFQTTKEDNDLALSIEDKSSWVTPLPFCTPRQHLPNNQQHVLSRLFTHLVEFMDEMVQNGHAELALPLRKDEECWYLPFFGFQGHSLNKALLTGPDLTNSLLGVLIRFRKKAIAIMVNTQQMFYSFLIREDHCNYLRFLWFSDEQHNQRISEYRMKVHVFGNGKLRSTTAEATWFVEHNFYVDNGLKSVSTPAVAIDLLKNTRQMLGNANLRLHKIASNSEKVLKAFNPEDHAKGLQDLDFSSDAPITQHSLGLCWDLKKDFFTFKTPTLKTDFMRKGVLQLLSPFKIESYCACSPKTPKIGMNCSHQNRSKNGRHGATLYVVSKTFTYSTHASTKAVAAVAYLRVYSGESNIYVRFVMGKAKLAPQQGHTIPWLELCGAALAAELADTITKMIDLELEPTTFYTDSKVVLGYIYNESRCFYVYVSIRVERIRRSSKPEQWRYVPTDHNPADHATRSIPASQLAELTWLKGPEFLSRTDTLKPGEPELYELLDPDQDADIRPLVKKMNEQAICKATMVKHKKEGPLEPARFERFSRWKPLVLAMTVIVCAIVHFQSHRKSREMNTNKCTTRRISTGTRMPESHHFTEGAVRVNGLWIIGAKRCIMTVLHRCLHCRKQRGATLHQMIADLPPEHLCPELPFTNVGLDVFGPWSVSARRTRGGQANSKQWAVLFTCLSIQAVHIEDIESMDVSCFINALRRFQACRGPVKVFRSDHGMNFVGACKELQIEEGICPNSPIDGYLKAHNCAWIFNPPHASHMGGAWECMIRIAHRILDSMLMKAPMLTHETLSTLMAEVAATINGRPLVLVSSDPENLTILTPATLLTQKMGDWPTPLGNFDSKDLYKQQWRQVQQLANTFWNHWKQEYLSTLQDCHKWKTKELNLEEGDLVLLKDKDVHRNLWPMGLVHKILPSSDGLVQVKVLIVRLLDSSCDQQAFTKKLYTRPITDLVFLHSCLDPSSVLVSHPLAPSLWDERSLFFYTMKHHLEGARHQVKVRMDHKNLEFLKTAWKLNQRQIRWADALLWKPKYLHPEDQLPLWMVLPIVFLRSSGASGPMGSDMGGAVARHSGTLMVPRQALCDGGATSGTYLVSAMIILWRGTLASSTLCILCLGLSGCPDYDTTFSSMSRPVCDARRPTLADTGETLGCHFDGLFDGFASVFGIYHSVRGGAQITAQFWKWLMMAFDVKIYLSSAHHPETNGRTEKVNGILEQYLCCFVKQQQDNWSDYLAVAEFAFNNSQHTSMETTPFLANVGYHPWFFPLMQLDLPVPEANVYLQRGLQMSCGLLSAGDTVIGCGGSDVVVHQAPSVVINPVAYHLTLPQLLHVQPIFHRSLLVPEWQACLLRQSDHPPPAPHNGEGPPEYEVTSIRDSRWLQYLIKRKGYGLEDFTWKDVTSVHAPALVDTFHNQFPSRLHPDHQTWGKGPAMAAAELDSKEERGPGRESGDDLDEGLAFNAGMGPTTGSCEADGPVRVCTDLLEGKSS
ncbi:infB, partial [Ophiophagus hannah]